MTTTSYKHYFEVVESGEDDPIISDRLTAKTFTTTNGVVLKVTGVTIADAFGEDVLWSKGDGGIDTFSHAFIFSTQELFVELRTDNGTPEYVLIRIPANVFAFLPGVAGGDTTESIDGADLTDGTDFDDVDQIRVQRDEADGEGDATVDLYIFN